MVTPMIEFPLILERKGNPYKWVSLHPDADTLNVPKLFGEGANYIFTGKILRIGLQNRLRIAIFSTTTFAQYVWTMGLNILCVSKRSGTLSARKVCCVTTFQSSIGLGKLNYSLSARRTMRYLLTTDDSPLLPLSEDDVDVCLKLLYMQMRRHNEEYAREHPEPYKPLVYLYSA